MHGQEAFVVFAIYCVTHTWAWPQDLARTAELRQRAGHTAAEESSQLRAQAIFHNANLRYHQRRSHGDAQTETASSDVDSTTLHLRHVGSLPSDDRAEDVDYQSDQSTQDVGLVTTTQRRSHLPKPRPQDVGQKGAAQRRPGYGQWEQSTLSYSRQRQNSIGPLTAASFQITLGDNPKLPVGTTEGKVSEGMGNSTHGFNGTRMNVPVHDNATRDDQPSSRRVGGQTSVRVGGNVATWSTQDTDKPVRNRVKLPDEGGIVFPGQGSGASSSRPRFIPRIHGQDGPACASGGMTFCDDLPEGYPAEYLNNKLRSEAVVYRELFGNDIIPPSSDISQRIDVTVEDQTLCLSNERIIYPKVGQTQDDQWLFIVNQDDYQQGVRIETCLNEDGECQFSGSFPQGYVTFCKQKYIYRKMLALNEMGATNPDSFKLPSCCVCHIRSPGFNFRMLVEPTRQSPAPGKRKRDSKAAAANRRK